MESITKRSDVLTQEIAKVMNQYMEGAITSPDACIKILVTLADWEKEICDESDALARQYDGESK